MRMAFLTLLAILAAASSVRADQFRCPNGNIIASGDSIGVAAAKCDPPASQVRREEPVETEKGRVRYVEVQEWTYNQPPSTLMHILTFRNGILTSVQTGGFVR